MGKIGNTELYLADVLVICLYFVIIIFIGFWSSYKSTRDSVSGYFLANRSMNWILVGASLFASNFGSEHFIGLAGTGASSGIGTAVFEIKASYVVLLLGWIFVPVYMTSGVYTMPEYLRKRFGGQRIRIYLAVLAFLMYIFTKISTDLYAGALFINQSIKLELYSSVLTLIIISALFTVTGGLTAVMWTDSIQTLIMIAGAFSLMVLSFMKVGGYNELMDKYAKSEPNASYVGYDINNQSCSLPNKYYNHFIRPATDSQLPWTGVIFGQIVPGIWYWCADQVIVQRVLSAKNIEHAKGGCILASYLKLIPFFLVVLPGMASRVLFPDIIGCSNPDKCEEACGNSNGCSNIAYPLLVLNLMPAGARGMMMFVMIASLMASLTSIFNSSTTIFTMDIWFTFRKQASEMELLIVGRVFVLFLVAVGIAWIPIIHASPESQLFLYIQSVQSYLAPPVAAVYLLAVLWSRINEKGAFWGLICGLVIGLIRFILEFVYTVPSCASKLPDTRPYVLSKVNYLDFASILFIIVCIITVVISLLTEPIAENHLYRLTFWTRRSTKLRDDLDLQISSKVNIQKISDEKESPGFHKSNSISMEDFNGNSIIQKEEGVTFGSQTSFVTKAFYVVCGLSEDLIKSKDQKVERCSQEEEVKVAKELMKHNPIWDAVCNLNAVIVLMLVAFCYGYFA